MQQSLLHSQEEEEKKHCACCTSTRLITFGVLTAILAVVLLLVSIYIPPIIHGKIDDGIASYTSIGPQAQKDNTANFATWADWTNKDSVPVHQTIWMMNITNPREILAGAKPSVTQHGPYVYRQFKRKFDISYSADSSNRQLVQFVERTWWEYDSSMSGAGLNPFTDLYTTVNLPLHAVTAATNNTVSPDSWFHIGYLGWATVGKNCPQYNGDGPDADFARMFESGASVNDWMFGFNHTCAAQQIVKDPTSLHPAGFFPGLLGPNYSPQQMTDAQVRQFTEPDVMYTGEDYEDYARQYTQWKGQTYLSSTSLLDNIPLPLPRMVTPLWGSATANRVTGSAGLKFASSLKEGSTVNTWVDELKRHAPIVNANKEKIVDKGITMLRYTLDPELLANSTTVQENGDYRAYRWNGLLDLSVAKQTLAIFMSKPHFLDADQALVDDVVGMAPNREAHDTRIDVEPLSGVTMRAIKRLQVNFKMQPLSFAQSHSLGPVKYNNWFPNTTGTLGQRFTPIAWVEESAEITESKASEFRSKVYGAEAAEKYLPLLGGIFGAVLIAIAAILLIAARKRAVRETEEATHVTHYNRQMA